MMCNVCNGTGWVNTHQIEEGAVTDFSLEEVTRWMDAQTEPHDVCICHCCGDGDTGWHGEPGRHYTSADPIGRNGPYAYNGGLCLCH